MPNRVYVYGTICQDRIMSVPRYPRLGSSVWVTSDTLTLGGEALNSALALSAWGLEVTLDGTILGCDERGGWILEQLKSHPHINSGELVSSADSSTPYCTIIATPDGERTMFGRHFNIMNGRAVASLPPDCVFTFDPYCGQPALDAALLARRMGLRVVGMDVARRPDFAAACDLIVTSYQELAPEAPEDELLVLGSKTAAALNRTLVLTLGSSGSAAFAPDGQLAWRQDAVPAEIIVDATGCGDVYRAGLVCGVCHGWPLATAMAFASAAASINLRSPGGGAGALSLEQTMELAGL